MESAPINFEEIRQNRTQRDASQPPDQPAKIIDLALSKALAKEHTSPSEIPANVRFLINDQNFFLPEIQQTIRPSDYINPDGSFDCHGKKQLSYKIVTTYYLDPTASEHITDCNNCKQVLRDIEPTPADD